MADISQIKLPNGDTYNLVDETSGYTSNTGTITGVKTTAGAHSTINVSSGAANFNVPTTAAHVGINFGYTTSGNNRAVQQDSNGNLYVTQKDNNTTDLPSMTGTLGIDHGGTGGTSALTAITNLGGPYLLAQGTEITASSNLDSGYKTMGTYYSANSTRTGTLTGTVPITSAGFKMITSIGYRTDTLRQFIGGANNDLLYRSSQDTGSTWTKWYKFAFLPSGSDNKTFSAIGGSTTPVYVDSHGVVTACSYTIAKSVPADAKFTDSGGTVTSITLTQGDGISIGSSGTAITTSGSRTIALSTSGATAGSYGPSADASPAHSGTFSVPYVTVDKYGRVTAISTKTITLPASGNTDTKVTVAALTSGTTYYPILATGTGTATRQIDSTLKGLQYVSTAGTADTIGSGRLVLGNNITEGTANNERGIIRLYGTTEFYNAIISETGYPTANRNIYLPSYGGTMYLTCTSTTNAVGGASTAPVYVTNTGRIAAVTSIPQSLIAKDILCAYGASGATTSLAKGTMTQVPLTRTLISNIPNSKLSLSSNRINISGAGIYRITASVYIVPESGSNIGVYIKQGTGTFANATEIASALEYITTGGAINVTKTIEIADDTTQYIYLGARSVTVAGTAHNDNCATYLEVEQLK